jgi:hypothetical protein
VRRFRYLGGMATKKQQQALIDDLLEFYQEREPLSVEEFGAAFASVVRVLGCSDGHAEAADDAAAAAAKRKLEREIGIKTKAAKAGK